MIDWLKIPFLETVIKPGFCEVELSISDSILDLLSCMCICIFKYICIAYYYDYRLHFGMCVYFNNIKIICICCRYSIVETLEGEY